MLENKENNEMEVEEKWMAKDDKENMRKRGWWKKRKMKILRVTIRNLRMAAVRPRLERLDLETFCILSFGNLSIE